MRLIKYAVLTSLILLLAVPQAYAQRSAPTIIRDAEIENMMQEWMEPVFTAANFKPEQVKIILVQNDQINAFVAGGANIFMYTGLLESTDSPGEVLGVMAHELGHIAGGHLIGQRAALERASYESIVGTLLGLGVAVAGGGGEAAAAISSGSSTLAARRFLAHSRINESSADQAAMNYLEGAELNPSGLVSFFDKLRAEELRPVDQQAEYARTHPLTSNRIDLLQKRLDESANKDKALPAKWDDQHARMKAKLIGFINPGRVPWVYSDRDKSIPAVYARAIAAYREDKIDTALSLMDDLLGREPDNPYFLELKGQILVDFGRIEEALPYYRQSNAILKDSALIQLALGHALLETGEKKDTKEAITYLEQALTKERRSSRARRLLATAYGRSGNEPMAKLHLAEEALLQKRIPYARRLATDAVNSLEEGSREWLQAKDILAYIEYRERNKN